MPNTQSLWDGRERRKTSQDHDTLIEVVQILKSHVSNFDRHTDKDDRQFENINRNMYIGLGILIAINGIPTAIAIFKALHGGG